MEKTVDNLELMFNKADADLKHLTLRLERQLDMGKGTTEEKNPVRLMKEIEGVKTEYTNLRQEIAGIQAAQKDAVDFLRSQLLSMSEMVQKLEMQTGQRNPELEETSKVMLTELSQLMGVPVESLQASTEPAASYAEQSVEGATGSVTTSESVAKSTNSSGAEAVEPEISYEQSAAERREAASEFVEVSAEEFASVSDLIRGRAKLEDVNKTYSLLWDHFKVQNHTEDLNPKEMNAMGLRVSGATGQAKLKVLRALKLCKIDKAGNVNLL
ncbi:hypothetical protein RRG08_047152 [Elysia crispata]|uniref:Protein FAM33A n=1 Tax=Elysia crispata TaxID=231223 RepID=A0AAE1D1Q9_9GAST|nr:hypothetical protein RRG08_047152 [Elysia crispata]